MQLNSYIEGEVLKAVTPKCVFTSHFTTPSRASNHLWGTQLNFMIICIGIRFHVSKEPSLNDHHGLNIKLLLGHGVNEGEIF